jgi:hypothetical protein
MQPSADRIVDAIKRYEKRRASRVMRFGRILLLIVTLVALAILLGLMKLVLVDPKGEELVTIVIAIGLPLGILSTVIRRKISRMAAGRTPVVSARADLLLETLLYAIVFCCLIFLILLPFVQ